MSGPRSVTVTTGARLHFGLCSLAPSWGGCGVMLEEPQTRVTASLADESAVLAPTFCAGTAAAAVRAVRPPGAGVRVEVEAAAPRHAGFGSGTQLTVAAATAVARLFGEPDPVPEELAVALGRGNRSRLGAAGFRSGGLLLDPLGAIAAARGDGVRSVTLPADWRWVVVRPRAANPVAGAAEAQSLAALPPMPRPVVAGLRRIVREILPLAAGAGPAPADAALLARVLGDYGARVGAHFAEIQGGTFASPAVRRWAADRADRGDPPPVQSSWGPTAAVPHASVASAAAEAEHVAALLGDAAEVTVAATRRRGASVVEA